MQIDKHYLEMIPFNKDNWEVYWGERSEQHFGTKGKKTSSAQTNKILAM